jgi:large subunit ribosomal protein L18
MAKNRAKDRRLRLKRSIRAKISGTTERPRLTVYRSNNHIYAQLIDDTRSVTVASASTFQGKLNGNPTDAGKQVGLRLAERAKEQGIESAVFDRNGYRYHGRVKALAEGAREGGLQF